MISEQTRNKLTTIAENEQKVYDNGVADGKRAEYDMFWDSFQRNGNRTDYVQAFKRWENEYIRPKYKVVPKSETITDGTTPDVSRYYELITGCPNLKKIEKEYFDLSQYHNENGYAESSSYGNYYTFSNNPNLEEIEDVGMQPYAYYNTFRWCKKLHTIEVIRSNENTTFNSAFLHDTPNLQNIRIEGVIPKNFSVQYSPLLSPTSLKSIVKHLKDYLGTSSEYAYTLTVETSAWEALVSAGCTDEDFAWIEETFGISKSLWEEFGFTWTDIVGYLRWNLVLA